MRKLALILTAALMLSACTREVIDSGTVISKRHIPISTHVDMMYTGGSNFIPITRVDPDEWLIIVQYEKKGQTLQRTMSVSKLSYDAVEVGKSYRFD